MAIRLAILGIPRERFTSLPELSHKCLYAMLLIGTIELYLGVEMYLKQEIYEKDKLKIVENIFGTAENNRNYQSNILYNYKIGLHENNLDLD